MSIPWVHAHLPAFLNLKMFPKSLDVIRQVPCGILIHASVIGSALGSAPLLIQQHPGFQHPCSIEFPSSSLKQKVCSVNKKKGGCSHLIKQDDTRCSGSKIRRLPLLVPHPDPPCKKAEYRQQNSTIIKRCL